MIIDIEHLFMSVYHLYSSEEKCLLRSFVRFFTRIISLGLLNNCMRNDHDVHFISQVKDWQVKIICLMSFYFFNLYLFIFSQRGREGEREGEKHQCLVASCKPHTGKPGLQPRHVPQLGIELATIWFAGQRSIHRATPAGVYLPNFILLSLNL